MEEEPSSFQRWSWARAPGKQSNVFHDCVPICGQAYASRSDTTETLAKEKGGGVGRHKRICLYPFPCLTGKIQGNSAYEGLARQFHRETSAQTLSFPWNYL